MSDREMRTLLSPRSSLGWDVMAKSACNMMIVSEGNDARHVSCGLHEPFSLEHIHNDAAARRLGLEGDAPLGSSNASVRGGSDHQGSRLCQTNLA